jgi:hypothetical protein
MDMGMGCGLTGGVCEDTFLNDVTKSQPAKLILKDGFIRNKNRTVIKSDRAVQISYLIADETVVLGRFGMKHKHPFGQSFNDNFNLRIPVQDVSGRYYRPGRQCETYLPTGFRLESLAAFLAGFPIQFYYIAF